MLGEFTIPIQNTAPFIHCEGDQVELEVAGQLGEPLVATPLNPE